MIDRDLYLAFCDDAFDQMETVLRSLGDDLVSRRPAGEPTNTAYGLVTHCIGVMGAWARQVNRGIEVARDRAAEFTATGTVDELLVRLAEARTRLHEDVRAGDPFAPPVAPKDDPTAYFQHTQGGVLMHVYEELAQHLGHLDLTRDVLLAADRDPVTTTTEPLNAEDRRWLARCVELAADALEAGDEPFGSVLVDADGTLRREAVNREITSGDATAHPELDLAQWAAHHLNADERVGATVYTSGEHCAMCAAAHAWVGLGRIVYVMSSVQLGALLGELGPTGPAAVTPLPVAAVAPGVRVQGPEPTLVPQMSELHRRSRSSGITRS